MAALKEDALALRGAFAEQLDAALAAETGPDDEPRLFAVDLRRVVANGRELFIVSVDLPAFYIPGAIGGPFTPGESIPFATREEVAMLFDAIAAHIRASKPPRREEPP